MNVPIFGMVFYGMALAGGLREPLRCLWGVWACQGFSGAWGKFWKNF